MQTIILVSHGTMAIISKNIGASYPTIRKALRGEFNENNPEERDRALRIRKCAINNGGKELVSADQNTQE